MFIEIIEICVCVCVCARMVSRVLTLCNPVECSLLGSSVHGIFQARILEWVAISYFRKSSWPGGWTGVYFISCINRQILYLRNPIGIHMQL